MFAAISLMDRPVKLSIWAAFWIFIRRKYSIGGNPVCSLNNKIKCCSSHANANTADQLAYRLGYVRMDGK